jgi:uncharacterized protein YdeI (YjbR/CyaY-like superfamily)
MKDNLPIILFETEQEWIDWLEDNGNEPGVWVQIAKKNSGVISISYQQALDVALCFGWIDGLKKKFDEKTFIQRFTARRPNSKWSKINRVKAELLIYEGKMRTSGLAAIEMAKQKGTWDTAYDSQKYITVPEDFQADLDKNPEAAEFFNSIESVNRYAILYRLQTARTPEMRSKKRKQFIEMLLRKERIHSTNS